MGYRNSGVNVRLKVAAKRTGQRYDHVFFSGMDNVIWPPFLPVRPSYYFAEFPRYVAEQLIPLQRGSVSFWIH